MSFAVVETYEMNGKRTIIPMAITASFALVLLLSLAALYKHLAPICKCKDSEPAVCATSNATAVIEMDSVAGICRRLLDMEELLTINELQNSHTYYRHMRSMIFLVSNLSITPPLHSYDYTVLYSCALGWLWIFIHDFLNCHQLLDPMSMEHDVSVHTFLRCITGCVSGETVARFYFNFDLLRAWLGLL